MTHSIGFTKTGCTSKISQISGFKNRLPKKSDLHVVSISQSQFRKNQFALTDPVGISAGYLMWEIVTFFLNQSTNSQNFIAKLDFLTLETFFFLNWLFYWQMTKFNLFRSVEWKCGVMKMLEEIAGDNQPSHILQKLNACVEPLDRWW